MKIRRVFLGVVGFAALACPTQGWSQPADVFPDFGTDKEVVSEEGGDFRGGMQCTEFVYKQASGLKTGMGNATDWDNTAKKRGYTVSSTPKDKSIGVIEKWSNDPNNGKYGHVYWVKSASKKSSNKYNMDIRHANWEKAGVESAYHDAVYNSGQVQIHNGKWLTSGGFITKWK